MGRDCPLCVTLTTDLDFFCIAVDNMLEEGALVLELLDPGLSLASSIHSVNLQAGHVASLSSSYFISKREPLETKCDALCTCSIKCEVLSRRQELLLLSKEQPKIIKIEVNIFHPTSQNTNYSTNGMRDGDLLFTSKSYLQG